MEPSLGPIVTALARSAVETSFDERPPRPATLVDRVDPRRSTEALRHRAATFVTWERGGRLRGCIGTLNAARPLGVDVVRNARMAARDPRMPPVTADELPELTVTVAVLSTPQPMEVDSFAALLDRLRPGTDGLTLTQSRRRATFLPTVWDGLREPEPFVAALLRKGGWPQALWEAALRAAPWPAGLAAERYTTETFSAGWAA